MGLPQKNMAREIRYVLLLPTSTFLLLFYPDYRRKITWFILNYWLFFNEHQLEETDGPIHSLSFSCVVISP